MACLIVPKYDSFIGGTASRRESRYLANFAVLGQNVGMIRLRRTTYLRSQILKGWLASRKIDGCHLLLPTFCSLRHLAARRSSTLPSRTGSPQTNYGVARQYEYRWRSAIPSGRAGL